MTMKGVALRLKIEALIAELVAHRLRAHDLTAEQRHSLTLTVGGCLPMNRVRSHV